MQEIVPAITSPGTPDAHAKKSLSRTNSDLDASRVSQRYEDKKALLAEQLELIENSIDSAETIVECAQHQKRIVDDILTMSKLDSKLLVDPDYRGSCPHRAGRAQDVRGRGEEGRHQPVHDRRARVSLPTPEVAQSGPSRLKQVLINLLTNALKFTKSERNRNVSVAIKASRTRPTDATSPVQFIPRSEPDLMDDLVESVVENHGDPVYLIFEVKDTGQGLTEEEKNNLFQRFVQASSRTHVKYGGSGLGLFISRRLTELQNGAIGVASQIGVGSTFAFYIEAYEPTAEGIQKAEAAEAEAKAASELGVMGPVSSMFTKTPGISRSGSKNGNANGVAALIPRSPQRTVAPPEIKGVLIVEDNLINQQITRRGLTTMGYTCDVANHGVEALDKLRLSDRFLPEEDAMEVEDAGEAGNGSDSPFPLSLILMDIEMPIQDGLTCTRNIRALEREGWIKGGRLPIIAVGANARNRADPRGEGLRAGDDVPVKPYRMPELIEKMKMVVAAIASGVYKGEERSEIDSGKV